MIDFVKAVCLNCQHLESLDLDFREELNTKTGETKNYKIAYYEEFKLKLYDSGRLILSGSLHKQFNGNSMNHDQFTFSKLKTVLSSLEQTFKIRLIDCVLQNIEFGVNIKPVAPIDKTLCNLFQHKGESFSSGFKNNFKVCEHADYFVKVYNKSYQFGLSVPVFRYELKFIKMRKVNSMGIYTLSDLEKSFWFDSVNDALLTEWEKILAFDFTLTEYETGWDNPNYWNSFANRAKKSRRLAAMREKIKSNSQNIYAQYAERIKKTWQQLTLN